MEDPELLDRLRRRDPEALDALVAEHHAPVYRFLRGLTRHPQEAEDLAQGAFVRAFGRLDTYSGAGPLRSWILGIAYREFTGWRRRRLWLPLLGDRPAPGDPYGDLVEAEALLGALARLPDGLRAVFLLHHVEEMPVAGVALALDVPEGTVKSRLHAARARLRLLLGEENHVPEAV